MSERRPLNECKILCTPASFGKKDPALRPALERTVGTVAYGSARGPLTAEDLRPLVIDVDGLIVGIDRVDASVIAAAPRLRVIACYGVGFDRVDVAEATRRGIVVTNSVGANSASVADLAVALMLALARGLVFGNDAVHRGQWPLLDGVGMREKTVGIVGLGAIGREVAKRVSAFGCHIVAFDPMVSAEAAQACGARLVSLDELLGESDFITLHAPATPTTAAMINRQTLKMTRKGAFLINTARGELIDEDALVDSLKSGQIRGAAFDCFIKEPVDPENPLLALPQVIVMPHSGSATDDALNQMGWTALENCLSVLKGERPVHVVNPEVLECLDF
jgi:D-3-phosphoglycerate dehydrogenase / 2-oxoglutarate reductase